MCLEGAYRMNAPETEIVFTKDGAEIHRMIVTPGDYVIGRETGCEIVVPADGVSRRHAKLIVNFDHALIEDLGSSNGTYVADRKIAENTRLFPNQVIRFGAVTMLVKRLKFEQEPDSMSPHSAAVKRHLPPDFLRDRKYDIGGIIARGGMGAIVDPQGCDEDDAEHGLAGGAGAIHRGGANHRPARAPEHCARL